MINLCAKKARTHPVPTPEMPFVGAGGMNLISFPARAAPARPDARCSSASTACSCCEEEEETKLKPRQARLINYGADAMRHTTVRCNAEGSCCAVQASARLLGCESDEANIE